MDEETIKALNMGYHMKIKTDETRLYDCGGIPVELTLPIGEHTKDLFVDFLMGKGIDNTKWYISSKIIHN